MPDLGSVLMSLTMQRFLAVIVPAGGLSMLALGSRRYASHEKSRAAATMNEEVEGGRGIRMCPPTAGEIAEDLGIKLAEEKLASLAVAIIGLVTAGASCVFLVPHNEER